MKKKITVFYNKNLKMSEGKLASQVGHVCFNLGHGEGWLNRASPKAREKAELTIVVLGLRQNKFYEKLNWLKDEQDNTTIENIYFQEDLGLTEVKAGTNTAFGYIEII